MGYKRSQSFTPHSNSQTRSTLFLLLKLIHTSFLHYHELYINIRIHSIVHQHSTSFPAYPSPQVMHAYGPPPQFHGYFRAPYYVPASIPEQYQPQPAIPQQQQQ